MSLTKPGGLGTNVMELPPLPLPLPLPDGVASKFVAGVNGLDIHYLEAGDPNRPLILLLHGFPELAYSWRKLMVPLAEGGFHVVAPDQRGYGRTTGWSDAYDQDLFTFRMPNLVRDAIGLMFRLGHDHAAHLVGHDFGASVAGWAGLLRPDLFRQITVMSAPFASPPALPLDAPEPEADNIATALSGLPRPRKHYQHYYSTPAANQDMMTAPAGLHAFMRAYFHMKSADWAGNTPHPLDGWTAAALAQMPTYYVMDAAHTIPEAVADAMPSDMEIARAAWLTEADMATYTTEYARTGFQGGLNWYRCRFIDTYNRELQVHAGKQMATPLAFIAGAQDWGVQQTPGALEAMENRGSTNYRGTHLISGAGHWVQQEQTDAVLLLLKELER
jgi:pimeloyl-ACP methyl ester carboxylesterase